MDPENSMDEIRGIMEEFLDSSIHIQENNSTFEQLIEANHSIIQHLTIEHLFNSSLAI